MALTGSETFGTVVPGFVTDGTGNLSVVNAGTNRNVVPGFVTDADGRLVVTTDATGATWQEGFIRNAAGALVVVEDPASPVYTAVPGFLTNATGAIAVTNDPGSPTWVNGFLQTTAGLAVTGLTSGWGGTYTESFTTNTAGWSMVPGDNPGSAMVRDTVTFDTTPAALRGDMNDDYTESLTPPSLPGPAGDYTLTARLRKASDLRIGNLELFVIGLDSDDNVVDQDSTAVVLAEGVWVTGTVNSTLVGASITKIIIGVTAVGLATSNSTSFWIDTVQLVKTA